MRDADLRGGTAPWRKDAWELILDERAIDVLLSKNGMCKGPEARGRILHTSG